MRLLPLNRSRPSSADSQGRAALWSATHAAILDGLFGDGYVIPGGADEVSRLVRPISLSADHTVLLIGAGTGGPVLSLATGFGAAVYGFEAVDAFANVAADRIMRAGLGSRVSVMPWSRSTPIFKPQVFDHALALMPIGGGEPEKILRAIGAAVKPGGHLVLLEIVADLSADADESAMRLWLARDRRSAMVPDETVLTDIIERLGFDVHMVEDVTGHHLKLAMAAWQRFLQKLEVRSNPATAAVLIAEAERSLSCCELMRAGRLRLVRWHAIQGDTRGIDLGAIKLEIMLSVQFRRWRDAIDLWVTLSEVKGFESEAKTLRTFIQNGIARDKTDLAAEVRHF